MTFLAQAPNIFEELTSLTRSTGLILILLIGAVLLLWLLRFYFRAPRQTPDPERVLREDLAAYPAAPGGPGPHRLRIHGEPVRLRLVVVAPVGKQTAILPDEVESILDQVLRGVGAVVQHDRPRVRVWPPQLSNRGFAPTFHRLVSKPDAEGSPSHWVLLAGPAKAGNTPVLLGLACWADESSTLGRLTVEPDRWRETLRIGSAES
ncbi:MAG: hypothetical protein K2R98_04610 [Gemmataceae bacterium]|nr:hypothetical protein [Gemmataceae bacterium]